MKKTRLIQLAALVAMIGLAACEKETAPAGNVVSSTSNHAEEAPWYESLVGTKWHGHYDFWIYTHHALFDEYWELITDSTCIVTINAPELMDEFPEEDGIAEVKYTYNPSTLRLTRYSLGDDSTVYQLDTIEKTMVNANQPEDYRYGRVFYHMVEE